MRPRCRRQLIVTRALADKLFPQGDALGKAIYTRRPKAQGSAIIGIVDRLQVPWVGGRLGQSSSVDNSMLEPFHYLAQYSHLPGAHAARAAAMPCRRTSRQKAVRDPTGARVLDKVAVADRSARTRSIATIAGLALILAVVCAALLAITAFGIVGLTSYWVAQRRRQIGIRRALGATRGAIVRYFQTENL